METFKNFKDWLHKEGHYYNSERIQQVIREFEYFLNEASNESLSVSENVANEKKCLCDEFKDSNTVGFCPKHHTDYL